MLARPQEADFATFPQTQLSRLEKLFITKNYLEIKNYFQISYFIL